ncbi:MAG TPA: dTDP-4-dehydrorhamnose 3,5-epimerase family protein [Thermoguttaceae bacterium]|nr:dTDP-4-dehydrorhamnose 3,5-epimerase family protein [Thermoguttaceae bacterium]
MKNFARKEPARFVDGTIDGVIVTALTSYVDDRGWLAELFRRDEIDPDHLPVMAYVSQTRPGTTRGPHEHREQTDVFAFLGDGRWRLWLWDVRADSPTWACRQRIDIDPENRLRVVVPPGVVHAYRNTGTTPACVFNAANRLYAGERRLSPVDEIRHENRAESPFTLD